MKAMVDMKKDLGSPEEYLDRLPEDRREAMAKLRNVLTDNLPQGYSEVIQYGMICYVVPLSLYPKGYRGDPAVPLLFICLASQKNYISLYHMGLYAKEEIMEWFKKEYVTMTGTKLDMGKSCIRFKKMDRIPYPLIGELARKITPEEWIRIYESEKK